jgi:hypothetical protein
MILMRKNRTELVFILDKSGSMAGLESDTIGGFNAMLKKQQKADGEAYVTTVLFDHDYDLLHDRIQIKGISSMTEKDYEVGGHNRAVRCNWLYNSKNHQCSKEDKRVGTCE